MSLKDKLKAAIAKKMQNLRDWGAVLNKVRTKSSTGVSRKRPMKFMSGEVAPGGIFKFEHDNQIYFRCWNGELRKSDTIADAKHFLENDQRNRPSFAARAITVL